MGIHVYNTTLFRGRWEADFKNQNVPCPPRSGLMPCCIQRTIEGHRQSDEHWDRIKGNVGEISERRGEAYMGFSQRIDTILS